MKHQAKAQADDPTLCPHGWQTHWLHAGWCSSPWKNSCSKDWAEGDLYTWAALGRSGQSHQG
jgi:hypothetical protein